MSLGPLNRRVPHSQTVWESLSVCSFILSGENMSSRKETSVFSQLGMYWLYLARSMREDCRHVWWDEAVEKVNKCSRLSRDYGAKLG